MILLVNTQTHAIETRDIITDLYLCRISSSPSFLIHLDLGFLQCYLLAQLTLCPSVPLVHTIDNNSISGRPKVDASIPPSQYLLSIFLSSSVTNIGCILYACIYIYISLMTNNLFVVFLENKKIELNVRIYSVHFLVDYFWMLWYNYILLSTCLLCETIRLLVLNNAKHEAHPFFFFLVPGGIFTHVFLS